MKDQLIQKLIEYLEATKDFALEQIPEVIKQMLRYEMVITWLKTLLFIILLITAITIAYKSYTCESRDKYESRPIEQVIGMFSGCIGSILLFIALCDTTGYLIKLYIAPKHILLEYLIRLKG